MNNMLLDQFIMETERLYRRKTGKALTLDRATIAPVGESLQFTARTRGSGYTVFHRFNPQWTIERNAWELGQVVHKNVTLGRNRII